MLHVLGQLWAHSPSPHIKTVPRRVMISATVREHKASPDTRSSAWGRGSGEERKGCAESMWTDRDKLGDTVPLASATASEQFGRCFASSAVGVKFQCMRGVERGRLSGLVRANRTHQNNYVSSSRVVLTITHFSSSVVTTIIAIQKGRKVLESPLILCSKIYLHWRQGKKQVSRINLYQIKLGKSENLSTPYFLMMYIYVRAIMGA